jgi:probable addiction module antidote protein
MEKVGPMTLQTKPYDSADYLDSEQAIIAYLKAAFEEGDADDIRAALNNVARARGMTGLSKETGVAREALYKALGKDGNPTLDTLLAVTRALGVKLSVAA